MPTSPITKARGSPAACCKARTTAHFFAIPLGRRAWSACISARVVRPRCWGCRCTRLPTVRCRSKNVWGRRSPICANACRRCRARVRGCACSNAGCAGGCWRVIGDGCPTPRSVGRWGNSMRSRRWRASTRCVRTPACRSDVSTRAFSPMSASRRNATAACADFRRCCACTRATAINRGRNSRWTPATATSRISRTSSAV